VTQESVLQSANELNSCLDSLTSAGNKTLYSASWVSTVKYLKMFTVCL
jgi:hypothetical protein